MNLLLCGVNHKTAPVALREKLACLIPDVAHAYNHLKSWSEVSESLLYTTCNRVEVMCVSEAPDEAAARVREFFASHPEIAPGDLDESFYVHRDREAVQHFFRVAASLDSMVVGEPQILGQVKQAYREATECTTPPGPSSTAWSTRPFPWPNGCAARPASATTR